VNLLKRQPFQSEGLRLEVRTSNNVPDTTHWLIVYLFHRGRIYDFMLWSHAGDWHLHSQEVEDFLASIVRFHDEDNPLRSGSFVSQIYGYQLELGEHWNLVELAPADSVAESLMVARLWTGPGLPYGFIIGFKHQGTAAAYIEQHLAGLATRKQLKGAPKMPGADPEGCIEYNTAMSVLQFHHTLRVIKKGDRLFHLEIWSTLKDAAEHQDTIRRISESLKVS
jgi:hypothetical protein